MTGWQINLGRWGEQTASIDRIDSTKGYYIDNIQWVHKDVNRMKKDFEENYLFKICEAIIAKRRLSSD